MSSPSNNASWMPKVCNARASERGMSGRSTTGGADDRNVDFIELADAALLKVIGVRPRRAP